MKLEEIVVLERVTKKAIRLSEYDILRAITLYCQNLHEDRIDKIELKADKPLIDLALSSEKHITPKKLEAIIFLKD